MLAFSACGFSVDVDMGGSDETTVEVSDETTDDVTEETAVEVSEVGDELVSFDNDWNLYTNYDEGYSLKIPKHTSINNCSNSGFDLVPVTVLREGNVSFVTPEYSYDFANGCTKYDIVAIPEERGNTWKIVSRDVANEDELESFVQDMYGEICTVNQVTSDGDVEINNSDFDGGCFINYMTVMKYNETAGKAYSFDLGQDINFYLATNDYPNSFDGLMVDSFAFLD